MTDLSVCIPIYHSRSVIANCLRSLPEACRGLRWEAIVVDNGSTDGAAGLVADEFPDVRLLANAENRGFAAATNQAAEAAQGRHLLLLNADTVPAPGSLADLVRFLDEHADAAAVGPRIRRPDGSIQTSIHPIPALANQLLRLLGINTTNLARLRMRGTRPRPVAALLGACMMVPRRAWDEIGPLDERFFFYLEDTDWCLRARRKGWQLHYWPEPEVLHLVGASALALGPERKAQYYQSLLSFFEKHYGARAAGLLGAALRLRGYRPGRAAGQGRRAAGSFDGARAGDLTKAAITAIVLARDEEQSLPACLGSLGWVDELIVVVSAESVDRTAEVARRYTPRVFVRPWEGFAQTRNWALEQAAGPWVLMVDADEVVTPELAAQMRRAVSQSGVAAYRMPRAFFFCGHRLRHGGCWPDEVTRLFLRGSGRYAERRVHERFEPTGPVGRLAEPLLHYGYRDLDEYFEKFSRYSELAARDLWERGRRVRPWDWLSPGFSFVNRYLLKAGFLDGGPGLVYAGLGAAFVLARTARLWELGKS
ncbi:MAG: glycosyltransferase [Armatimonadota bacterium]